MTDGLPLTHVYNLARLGHAGDVVQFTASSDECEALARWSGVLSVEKFSVRVEIKKLSPSKFALDIALTAEVVQSCVVSLEPVPAGIERRFTRELHFSGPARRGAKPPESETISVDMTGDEEPPEDIESPHYDLARPVLEEYALSLDPYPRAKGAEFGLKEPPEERPESPFAALKALKSGS